MRDKRYMNLEGYLMPRVAVYLWWSEIRWVPLEIGVWSPLIKPWSIRLLHHVKILLGFGVRGCCPSEHSIHSNLQRKTLIFYNLVKNETALHQKIRHKHSPSIYSSVKDKDSPHEGNLRRTAQPRLSCSNLVHCFSDITVGNAPLTVATAHKNRVLQGTRTPSDPTESSLDYLAKMVQ